MPKPTRRVPEEPGRPTPREAIARATAAAGPRVAKAVEAATPKVEKAAQGAGRLLGTLRERARITAKEFADAYHADDDAEDRAASPEAKPAATERPATERPATERPRPRPRPRKD